MDQVSAHISGGRGGGGVFISLKPLEERGISAQQVIGRLRGKMSSEPGLQIFLQAAQDIMMGGRSSRSQYQYTLQADDLDSLRRWGRRLQQEFAGIRILKDVDSDIEERGLQTLLTINRDALARLGLTMKDMDAALNNAFGQRQVSTIYEEKNQYRVVLEYALPWLEGEDSLGKVWLPGKDGAVPLLGVAEVSPAFAPLSVAHQGQFAAVTLSFNLAEGASLSQAQAAIDEARVRECLEKAGLTERVAALPDGLKTHIGREVFEDGVLLSGGEMQRLMLARALYKNAPILLLDEPTAALDPIAENDIYQKYAAMTVGRTSVFISHRLASTRFCDRILLIDGGVIAEQGSHEELLARGGKYAELFEVQSKYYREEGENDGREE